MFAKVDPGMQLTEKASAGVGHKLSEKSFASAAEMMPVPTGASRQTHQRSIHHGRSVLNVSSAGFTVTQRQWGRQVGEKEILKDVSVVVQSGETLAVMGPSGAGKTTFMDLLTLEGAGGKRTGYVDLNGAPITPGVFRKYCSYVPQHDNGWAFLTCRESLQFAARFHMGDSAEVQQRRVEELLTTMGLETCQHTYVGNEFLKGLSGGQRRRLSLAVAFLKNPLVIFLDEVTSGLDAAAAASITKFLQDLARRKDVIIVCTIHQPSSKIFRGFDRLLLLSGGRVAYSGKTSEAAAHFQSLGYAIPVQENPADFFLDTVNSDFNDREKVSAVLDAWASRPPQVGASGTFEVQTIVARKAPRRLLQVWVLLRRTALLAVRDPTVYVSRLVFFAGACCFFALVYIKSRDRVQDQVYNRLWLILWHMGVPASMAMAGCLGQNMEFTSVRREVRAGTYRLSAYFLAQLLIQIPFLFMLSAVAISPSGYGIANWNSDAFFTVLVVHMLLLFSFECAAQCFAVQFAHPLMGLFNFINFWFATFLFGGFLVPEKDTPWPLRALGYISPMKFATKAIIYAELHDTTFEGAVLDSDEPNGFRCLDGVSSAECFGATGDQVLKSMAGSAFKHLSPENEFWKDCGVLLAIAATFRLLYFAFAIARCSNRNQVVPPAQETGDESAPMSLALGRLGRGPIAEEGAGECSATTREVEV